MKKYKLLAFTFLFAIGLILIPHNTYAATYGICLSGVKYQEDSKTGTINKTEWGAQAVRINNAFTSLTNPCPNCEFRVKPHSITNGTLGGTVVKMSSSYTDINISDGSGAADQYYLKVARFDFTLLESTVDLTWRYQ